MAYTAPQRNCPLLKKLRYQGFYLGYFLLTGVLTNKVPAILSCQNC